MRADCSAPSTVDYWAVPRAAQRATKRAAPRVSSLVVATVAHWALWMVERLVATMVYSPVASMADCLVAWTVCCSAASMDTHLAAKTAELKAGTRGWLRG